MKYNKVNNIVGWSVFAIAFLVYLFSMAKTASFWDCGEFIACSNELEVPHPPGAPFFLILGRFFAMFASEPTDVAFMVNMVSVLSSAFCVLFVFWSVTHLARKLVSPDNANPDMGQMITIMAAGVVGGLACTFADSFWFNAVEAEVYALSSFFTGVVVWLMFKWEARSEEPDNMKWIVLIAFIMGISIGAHLLNLLTIPALAFIYYFKKYPFTWQGAAITFGISVFILGFIQYGVIQMSVDVAWFFESTFTGIEDWESGTVEGWGFPMGVGLTVFLLLAMGIVVALIAVSQSDKLASRFLPERYPSLRGILNVSGWSIMVIIIGYSSYSMIVIRANAEGLPINENDPSSIPSMSSYLKREQYGDRPLFYGVRYNNSDKVKYVQNRKSYVNIREPRKLNDGTFTTADGKTFNVAGGIVANGQIPAANEGDKYVGELKSGKKIQIDTKTGEASRLEDRYVWLGYKQDVEYTAGKVLFPRMHSASHYQGVGQYGYEHYVDRKGGPNDKNPLNDKPTMGEDFVFFLDYQFRHMYWRYFMWNFAGRAGDIQDMSWDAGFTGGDGLPTYLAEHPGRNHYYFLPLLFGLFGMVYHFGRNRKDATSVLLLFFFTGLAIILYLNQTPQQPRERDYSYAGSFQTFAIWIGLSVIGVYDLLRELARLDVKVSAALSVLPIVAPIIMGLQNWDDHTRALRYVAPDSAHNLLQSVKKNGIIFTNGDNDTFPLWYIQEVEGVRTDVRVVNLSLLNTDWYIQQMKQDMNDSPGLPITAPQEDYIGDRNAARPFPAKQPIEVPVNIDSLIKYEVVRPEDLPYVTSPMVWEVGVRKSRQGTYLLKQDWIIMDIILTNANQGWKRPIYFSSTIPPSSYMNLQDYFQLEGLASRLVPVDFTKTCKQINDQYGRGRGRVDPDQSYKLLTEVFKYRELNNEDLYIDDHIRKTIVGNTASAFYRCANAYLDDADCFTGLNRMARTFLASNDSLPPTVVDSTNRAIATREAKIKEFQEKAASALDFCEKTISDQARGYDSFYPALASGLYRRLGNEAKAREYFDKVYKLADEWISYYVKTGEKAMGHDRFVGALSLIAREAEQMGDTDYAIQVIELMKREAPADQAAAYDQYIQQIQARKGLPVPGRPQ